MTAKEDNATVAGIIISVVTAVALNAYFGYPFDASIILGISAGVVGGIITYYTSGKK